MTTKLAVKAKARVKVEEDKPVQDVLTQIDSWLDDAELNWFHISKAFPQVYDEELYKTKINVSTKKPYETFKEYVEQHLGLDYRLAMWRLQNGRAIHQFKISAIKVANLGWSKFKEITSVLRAETTQAEVDKLLKAAEGKTFVQVQDMVKKERIEKAGGVHHRKVTMKFSFLDEQASVIEHALNEAKTLSNTENISLALEYICMEWLMNHNPEIASDVVNKLHTEKKPPELAHKKHANAGKKMKKGT